MMKYPILQDIIWLLGLSLLTIVIFVCHLESTVKKLSKVRVRKK